MNNYTIYCTPEQTKKALGLGAPIDMNETKGKVVQIDWNTYIIPTSEQLIGWLEEQDIELDIEGAWDKQFNVWVWDISKQELIRTPHGINRKEAILAAIDVALEYLINKRSTNNGKDLAS